MNINLDTCKLRFFENEGRAFACGEKSFQLWDPSLKGENALVAPFGVKTYDEKSVLCLIVPDDLADKFQQFEQCVQEKMTSSIPEFIKGTQTFHSCIKTNQQGQKILTVKVNSDTCIEMYDVKKGTFSRVKMDGVPSGSRLSLGFTMKHPWKFEINNVMKYGVSFIATDIVLYNDGDLKRKISDGKKSIKDLMTQGSKKKKTKMMDYKEQAAL